jgi:hypothetical protein
LGLNAANFEGGLAIATERVSDVNDTIERVANLGECFADVGEASPSPRSVFLTWVICKVLLMGHLDSKGLQTGCFEGCYEM